MAKKVKKNKTLQKVLLWLLYPFVKLYFKLKFNFSTKVYQLPQPCLLLGPHNASIDPIATKLATKQFVTWVSNDNTSSNFFAKNLLTLVNDIIPIYKGRLDFTAVRQIIEAKNQGTIVGLYPTGNATFNGGEEYIKPSVVKLIRQLKIPVVFYAIEGTYLTAARWKRRITKGKMVGEVKLILQPEQYENMTDDELYSAVVENCTTNAVEIQRKKMVVYKGNRRAEYLEALLYTCPQCNSDNSNVSKGNYMTCTKCGHKVFYNKYSFLEGGKFDNIYDWDIWQRNQLVQRTFADDAPALDSVWTGYIRHSSTNIKKIGKDRLLLYKDRIQFGKLVLPINQIDHVSLIKKRIMFVGLNDGRLYRFNAGKRVSTLQYYRYINFFAGKFGQPDVL